MSSQRIKISLVLIFALLLGGCSFPWQKKKTSEALPDAAVAATVTENGGTGQIKKFSDYKELRAFLEEQSTNAFAQMNSEFASGDLSHQQDFVSDVEIANYSSAIVKVDGVDEADVVKIDGPYVYALVYNDLYIIKALPASEARAVSKITFNSRPSKILLENGRLVALGADEKLVSSAAYKSFRRQSPYTFVKIFDLTEPEAPKQIRDLNFEGSYRDARIVSGRLYLVIDNYSKYVSGEILTPRLIDNGKILANDCAADQRCFAPDVYYFDIPYDSYNFTSIDSFDLKDKEAKISSQTYILSGSQNIYLSAKNLYISHARYLNIADLNLAVMKEHLGDRLSAGEKERLAKIESTDSSLLTSIEKKQKALIIYREYVSSRPVAEQTLLDQELQDAIKIKYEAEGANLERTLVYKFSFSGGQPVYHANGTIAGVALNKYSFNEDAAGNLLVLTASSGIKSAEKTGAPYSSLFILNKDLKMVGSISKLAIGKNLQAAGIFGQRVYLYPDKLADPLIALDISDISKPKLLGELKVPGTPVYLHPYDANTLIGLGRDLKTDAYGNTKIGGVKLSLIDVSNPLAPVELDSYVSGIAGSNSLAFESREAFLYSREKNILAVPVSLTSTASDFSPYFAGALVFSVSDGKLSLRGQIDHSDGGKYQQRDASCGHSCFDSSVRRLFFLQDSLYTFSNKYLKVNGLSDISALQVVKLVPDSSIDLDIKPMEPLSSIPESSGASTIEPAAEAAPIGPAMPPVEIQPETPIASTSDPVVATPVEEVISASPTPEVNP